MNLLTEKKKEKELTEQQEKFLSVLFSEAQGSPQKAGEIVGYHPSTWPKVVKALRNEIIEQAENVLAAHSPKAVMSMTNALDADGSIPQANIRMEAAKQILDRVGIAKREKLDIEAKIQQGIFILPAKEINVIDAEDEKGYTVPFGYKLAEDNHSLEPIEKELTALEKAKEYLENSSYREVAQWVTATTGRYISHVGLIKAINRRT